MFRRVALRGSVAAFMASQVAGLGLLATAPAHAAGTCPDVWYLGARGSGETSSGHHGMGAAVGEMGQVVHDAVVQRGMSAAWLGIDYSADSVDDLIPTRREIALFAVNPAAALLLYKTKNVDKYDASIADGISETVGDVHTVLASCPNAQIILAGYSQGAIAVHDAENKMIKTEDASITHVAGTLLLGDGDRVPYSQAHRFGSSALKGEGLRPWLHLVKKHDVPLPDSTAEICNAGDIVCDFSKAVFRHPQRAAAVHTHYAQFSGGTWHYDPILHDAATWVAGKVKIPTIRFDGSPGTDAPPATLGGYAMTSFGADPQPIGDTSSVQDPAGTLDFETVVDHETVPPSSPAGWSTWSHGYTGDVYISTTSDNTIVIDLPSGTKAFYFYAEPDDWREFDVTATGNGTTTATETVEGKAGASYFGFYATGGHYVSQITVSTSEDFAVGEFGIAR